MKRANKIRIPFFTLSAILLVCVFVTGAFSMSNAQKMKKEIARDICAVQKTNCR